VPVYSSTLAEHDRDLPWIVVSQEHRTVTLDDTVNFHAWAAEQWPAPQWTIELEPQLPEWPRDRPAR
jgi:hypothetical protein